MLRQVIRQLLVQVLQEIHKQVVVGQIVKVELVALRYPLRLAILSLLRLIFVDENLRGWPIHRPRAQLRRLNIMRRRVVVVH